MRAATIRSELESFAGTFWQDRRGVLSMSKISEPIPKLLSWFWHGQPEPDSEAMQEAYLGLVFEDDIKYRLRKAGLTIERAGEEIALDEDERCTGHIEGIIEGELLEIVSCREASFDRIVSKQRLPEKKFMQVQFYMEVLGIEHSKVILISRERGRLFVLHIPRIPSVGESCREKALIVLNLIDTGGVAA